MVGANTGWEPSVMASVNRLYTTEEMASILGISIHTLYAKTSRRGRRQRGVDLPPFIRLGKLIRFADTDYLAWVQQKERHGVSA